LNPHDAESYLFIGTVLDFIGRSGEAIEAIKEAMRLNPHYSAIYAPNLAIAYRNLGQYQEAIASLEEALSLNPYWVVTYWEIANNYLDLWATHKDEDSQALDKAITMTEKCVAIDDSFRGIAFLFIQIYLNKRQYEKALAEAEKLIDSDPNYADSYGVLAVIFLYMGRLEESIEMIEKAMRLNPAIPAWYLTVLGAAYASSDRRSEAIATYKRVFDRNPTHRGAFDTHINLAILYIELDQDENAQAEVEELLKLVPNFSVEVWGQRHPMKDREIIEQSMTALRRAGLT